MLAGHHRGSKERHLQRQRPPRLAALGETVLDASTVATARVRELSRGGRRKNDVINASAAASVAALQGDTAPVAADDDTVVFALLEE